MKSGASLDGPVGGESSSLPILEYHMVGCRLSTNIEETSASVSSLGGSKLAMLELSFPAGVHARGFCRLVGAVGVCCILIGSFGVRGGRVKFCFGSGLDPEVGSRRVGERVSSSSISSSWVIGPLRTLGSIQTTSGILMSVSLQRNDLSSERPIDMTHML